MFGVRLTWNKVARTAARTKPGVIFVRAKTQILLLLLRPLRVHLFSVWSRCGLQVKARRRGLGGGGRGLEGGGRGGVFGGWVSAGGSVSRCVALFTCFNCQSFDMFKCK